MTTDAPALTIGLPVYNGEKYLRQALDSLQAQTFSDFELIISDNASSDSTPSICREYAARDERIRYMAQPKNIGAGPNHNLLPLLARGRYFKWASHDDLYHPELLRLCMAQFEEHPEAILVHCWDARIDIDGNRSAPTPYTLDSSNPSPSARMRSLLRDQGGDDFYGVIRTDVLLRRGPHGSHFNADRNFVVGLALYGPFRTVPQVLYYRRERPDRLTRSTIRERASGLDPRRANRLRHPNVRLYAEYLIDYPRAIQQAPLSARERWRCHLEVVRWMASVLVRVGRTGALHAEVR